MSAGEGDGCLSRQEGGWLSGRTPIDPAGRKASLHKRFPVALIIMDGLAYGAETADASGDAIRQADTPVLDALWARWPHTRLAAAGADVGLPEGQMGNSEVGHLNIGAGRVIYQELTRIDRAIEDGSFAQNEQLRAAMKPASKSGESEHAVHLIGLLSDGGVHSHMRHLYALIALAVSCKVPRLYVHAFLDGRDTAPTSGAGYLRQLEEKLTEARNPRDTSGPLSLPDYRIASVMGRYWAMDRDKRWDRTKKAHEALVRGRGLAVDDVVAALEQRYQEGISDEFIEPLIVGAPAPIQPGDTVIFFNFRPDRARQLTATLLEDPDLSLVTLTEYDPELKGVQVAFPKTKQTDTLADVLSAAGLRQLHIAETEKYAHVTFFLNGGEEEPKVGEQRILIPSPKVATYDLQPEMSAVEVTDTLLEAIETDAADVYIVNYANGDMVGHTGIMEAAAKAVETVDTQLGRVAESILHRGGALLITADHGNAEQMAGMDALTPHTAHTTNSVPLILAGTEARALAPGRLSDVAPTLLKIIGLDAPKSWTGRNLVIN